MSEQILEVGKTYTVVEINGMLACSIKRVISVERFQNEMAIIKDIEKGRKSRKVRGFNVGDQLIFPGTDIPFNTDFNAVDEGTHDTFHGNACFNLVGKEPIEEIRKFIEANNLNPRADMGDVLYHDVPVFPELSDSRVLEMSGYNV